MVRATASWAEYARWMLGRAGQGFRSSFSWGFVKVLFGQSVVEVDGAADISAFLAVGAGEEATFKSSEDEVAELAFA